LINLLIIDFSFHFLVLQMAVTPNLETFLTENELQTQTNFTTDVREHCLHFGCQI